MGLTSRWVGSLDIEVRSVRWLVAEPVVHCAVMAEIGKRDVGERRCAVKSAGRLGAGGDRLFSRGVVGRCVIRRREKCGVEVMVVTSA